MKRISNFLENELYGSLLLLLCSSAIYICYFHHILLNLNSIVSSITLDTLKNYYTYAYHIKNDQDFLNFAGMNYPFGEHPVYTDCQPLLTLILRFLPFTHNYLIGILHGIIFLSFIITPLILNKIFIQLSIDRFSCFFFSLGIALLSPQFLKMNSGHFALAYTCVIPFSVLLLLSYLKESSKRKVFKLFLFNTLLFFVHPYLGFSMSLFSFIVLFLFEIMRMEKSTMLLNILRALVMGIIPPLVFRLFMLFTDHHSGRTPEPYGTEAMVENPDSLLAPIFGPFRHFLEGIFPHRTSHFEGHSYLGFFTILLALLFIVLILPGIKKVRFDKKILALFMASFLLLLAAFGFHYKLLGYSGINSSLLNQFRASSRFAWFFYYMLPIFLVVVFYQSFKLLLTAPRLPVFFRSLSVAFFLCNMLEADAMFKMDRDVFWKQKNPFNANFLNAEEKMIIGKIRTDEPQALMPLPLFHGGSEMYDRAGFNNSMIPSVIYSYHSGIPIYSVLLSRTSIPESEEMIGILNAYKKKEDIFKLLNDKPFLVLKTADPLLPDEERLVRKVHFFYKNDSLEYGYINKSEMQARPASDTFVAIRNEGSGNVSQNVVFISSWNGKPYMESNMKDYGKVFELDSNKVNTDNYIVSFHIYYTEKIYKSLACNFIITCAEKDSYEWLYNVPVRLLSGFYNGYGVFEYRMKIESRKKYEFIFKGEVDRKYRISNFMLRPYQLTVLQVTDKHDTIFNNFPDK